MKLLFLILSILVSGAAAYFTLSETEKFETEQGERLTAISTNTSVSKTLAETTLEIGKEENLLKAAKEMLATDTASVSFLESNVGNLTKEVNQLDALLETQRLQIEETLKGIAEINQLLVDEGGGVTPENFQDKVVEIEDEVKTKQTRLDEMNVLLEGAKLSLANNRAAVERLVEKKQARNKRIATNSIEARITAVNSEWGFVVIGAGSNSGFTPQTSLYVKRDGRLIGKVKPSAIEPTQTIAEIDLESLAPGVRIQPGDKVILSNPAQN